jgi:23S rRNA (pseudouridine1915-N3)-methyltransferase
MHISIIAVGKKMPDWINQAIAEYSKRLSGDVRINLTEVTAERRGKTLSIETSRLREARKIRAALPQGNPYISLDEAGKQLATGDIATKLAAWIRNGQAPSLIIGGADGLHPSLKQESSELWSLSKLTLPHALARLILVEQIYRAWTILKQHPYHRR